MVNRKLLVAAAVPLQSNIINLWSNVVRKEPTTKGIVHWYMELRRGYIEIDRNIANIETSQVVDLCTHLVVYGIVLVNLFNIVAEPIEGKNANRLYELCDAIIDGVEELQMLLDNPKVMQ